jgi:hypothetical protein
LNFERILFFSCRFKAVKDYRLFIFVGILFVMDTVLLTSWQIVDPLKIFKDVSQTSVYDIKNQNIIVIYFFAIDKR